MKIRSRKSTKKMSVDIAVGFFRKYAVFAAVERNASRKGRTHSCGNPRFGFLFIARVKLLFDFIAKLPRNLSRIAKVFGMRRTLFCRTRKRAGKSPVVERTVSDGNRRKPKSACSIFQRVIAANLFRFYTESSRTHGDVRRRYNRFGAQIESGFRSRKRILQIVFGDRSTRFKTEYAFVRRESGIEHFPFDKKKLLRTGDRIDTGKNIARPHDAVFFERRMRFKSAEINNFFRSCHCKSPVLHYPRIFSILLVIAFLSRGKLASRNSKHSTAARCACSYHIVYNSDFISSPGYGAPCTSETRLRSIRIHSFVFLSIIDDTSF